MTYTTIEEAQAALETAAHDLIADHGEEQLEAAWHDLVEVIADFCTPAMAEELKRRNLSR